MSSLHSQNLVKNLGGKAVTFQWKTEAGMPVFGDEAGNDECLCVQGGSFSIKGLPQLH